MNLPPMIILDGPKGAGKSTIAQRLVEVLNENNVKAKYHKHIRDKNNEFLNMHQILSQTYNETLVIDRFVWTEWVMGVYTKRVPIHKLTEECLIIDRLIRVKEIPHIILLPSIITLQNRLANRDTEERKKVDMPWDVINPLWQAAYGLSKDTILYINETPEDQKRLVNYLLVSFSINTILS